MRDAMLLREFFGAPLLLEPTRARQIGEVLLRHSSGVSLTDAQVEEALRHHGDVSAMPRSEALPKSQSPSIVNGGESEIVDGVAHLVINGPLKKRGAMIPRGSSNLVGMEGVAEEFDLAMADPNVKAVLLDIDSPGGTVDGTYQLADKILGYRGTKPVGAYCNGVTASGGYAIACNADPGRIFAYRTSAVGSIGVYSAFLEFKEALENEGIKPHLIAAGKFKAQGHPFKAHDEEQLADLQRQVDQYYGHFVDGVSRARGIDAQAVRDTEARLFVGAEAVEAGLVDTIGSIDDLHEALLDDAARHTDTPDQGADGMTRVQKIQQAAGQATTTRGREGVKPSGAKGEHDPDDEEDETEDSDKKPEGTNDDEDETKKDARAVAQHAATQERARARDIKIAAKSLGFGAEDPLVEQMLDDGHEVKGATKILTAAAGSKKASDPMRTNYESQTPLLGQPTVSNAQGDASGAGAGPGRSLQKFQQVTAAVAQELGAFGPVDPSQASFEAAKRDPDLFIRANKEFAQRHPNAQRLLRHTG